MSSTLDTQTLEEAYEHGLCTLAAYGKEYKKGEALKEEILQQIGFTEEAANKFSKTHTILDQYDSWTGISDTRMPAVF